MRGSALRRTARRARCSTRGDEQPPSVVAGPACGVSSGDLRAAERCSAGTLLSLEVVEDQRHSKSNRALHRILVQQSLTMKLELNALEARVIGCLIEKQVTTPDQYPLSLNALLNACNQKSNRVPVMDLDEATLQRTLDDLTRKHLLLERSGFGSRVAKYRHCFCNTEFGTLKFDPHELAIVCELLLRGPQTPGELRSRASRMASFSDVSEVESILKRLSERDAGAYVSALAREPGRRESRYTHRFGGEVAHGDTNPDHAQSATSGEVSAPEMSDLASGQEQRLTRLEREVQALQAELSELKLRLGV
jgi:uncharacterized protein